MKRIRHNCRQQQPVSHQCQNWEWLQAPSRFASPGSTSRRCRSRGGRRLNSANPLTQYAATAWADHAATRDRTGRQGDAQVRVTGCRPCGQALPEGSRRHLNRCQDVRANRSTGQPKAWLWSGNCTDWRCKYGYHHTTVLQGSRLDAETLLAKGKFPLESLRWSSPSVKRLRLGFDHAFCMIGQGVQSCIKWQPDGCPLIIAILIRDSFGKSAESCRI
jgi:hypothetical protein